MSSWWGEVGGAVIGGLVGGPVGAIVGAALGHGVDSEIDSQPTSGFQDIGGAAPAADSLSPGEEAQIRLLMGMIALAGKLAKIDGHVSKEEVAVVSAGIKELEVDEEGEAFLKNVFREAKQSPHDYREVAEDIRRLRAGQADFAAHIVGFLLHIAIADGVFSDSERVFIDEVSRILGLPQEQYRQMVEEICPTERLDKCYEVLGLPRTATMAEVKARYRKLVTKFHPDKLSGKDLAAEFERFAQEKMASINEAYETILAAQKAG